MRYILSLLTALTVVAAMAVPARRVNQTITLPDGSQVQAVMEGDEDCHFFTTASGQRWVEDANGVMRPFDASKVRPKRRASVSRAGDETLTHIPRMGQTRIPVLLVEYADVKFIDANTIADSIRSRCDGSGKSVGQYFRDQSQGLYDPQFDIYGPVTLSQNRAYYGANNYAGIDKAIGEMVVESCELLDSEVNFKDYDCDGENGCDVVIVIYAGEGENAGLSGLANSIWPCQWELSQSDMGGPALFDGVEVNKFAVFNESYRTNSFLPLRMDGIGTFVHEFSHCLGLPDFYTTNGSSRFGMNIWSVMDYASYNDNSNTPLGYSAYEKSCMGWLDLTIPQGVKNYTLQPLTTQFLAADYEPRDQALVLYNDEDENEFFIFEARSRQGWDAFMPADGLLVTHVTFDPIKWFNNTVNNFDVQGYTIVPADGQASAYTLSLQGDLYPYEGNDSITDNSWPAAVTNLGTQRYLHKPVTHITRNQDLSISLRVNAGASGIEETGIEEDGPVTYYDLTGREVAEPRGGVFIRRQGRKTSKVVI